MESEARKVMLLDEDLIQVMKAEKHLLAAGYEVVSLTSANGVLSKVDYERPDILLLDIEMRRLNATDLLATLRASEDYEDLVIVLFSDLGADQLQKLCIENDINGYFCKSMDVSQIGEFLNNFFEYGED